MINITKNNVSENTYEFWVIQKKRMEAKFNSMATLLRLTSGTDQVKEKR